MSTYWEVSYIEVGTLEKTKVLDGSSAAGNQLTLSRKSSLDYVPEKISPN
jgi:hypothetical protein